MVRTNRRAVVPLDRLWHWDVLGYPLKHCHLGKTNLKIGLLPHRSQHVKDGDCHLENQLSSADSYCHNTVKCKTVLLSTLILLI